MRATTRYARGLLVLGALLLAAPAYADDPVVNYVRVSVDSDTQMNCNDLNVEIANVNRDIGLLESQDEQLQGIASQGAQTFVPQSTNAGNALELFSNTMGDAAVIDAENSIPAVEASLSTARARVGYLESLQGSCGNNNAPPPQQQQAPPPVASGGLPQLPTQREKDSVDLSAPSPQDAVDITVCNKSVERARLAVDRLTGAGNLWVKQGWWEVPAHQCVALPSIHRGKLFYHADGYRNDGARDMAWGSGGGDLCVVEDNFTYWNYCEDGERHAGTTLVDLSNASTYTIELKPVSTPVKRKRK